jgi:hypothetical protein
MRPGKVFPELPPDDPRIETRDVRLNLFDGDRERGRQAFGKVLGQQEIEVARTDDRKRCASDKFPVAREAAGTDAGRRPTERLCAGNNA